MTYTYWKRGLLIGQRVERVLGTIIYDVGESAGNSSDVRGEYWGPMIWDGQTPHDLGKLSSSVPRGGQALLSDRRLLAGGQRAAGGILKVDHQPREPFPKGDLQEELLPRVGNRGEASGRGRAGLPAIEVTGEELVPHCGAGEGRLSSLSFS